MLRCIFIILLISSSHLHAEPRWYWEDHFTAAQKQDLTQWVIDTNRGIEKIFGDLPYSFNVYFHRLAGGKEPVPWAHTSKGRSKSVHFYVDMKHSMPRFKQDWTAPHELAHLLFPYLGQNSAWFAEGIASYLQYQIMYANQVISWNQGVDKLEERFKRARRYKQYDNISIVELSKIVRQTGAYVRLYWGGASYFTHVDKTLYEEKNIRLNDVIREYLKCCTHKRINSAISIMNVFNEISNSKIFTEVYRQTVLREGFPETKTASRWLRQNPPRINDQPS